MVFHFPDNILDLAINYSVICLTSYFMSVYVFCKSQNVIIKTSKVIYSLILGILFTLIFVLARFYNLTLSYLLYYSIVPILLTFLTRKRNLFSVTIVAVALVSTCFVSVVEVVAVLIQGTVSWLLGFVPSVLFASLLTKIIALLLCILIMNIRRFRKGFQFFQKEKNIGLGLALSAVVIMLRCMNLRDNRDLDYIFIVFVFGIIIAGFGLYLWIRRSITAHYRERMQLKSEEHYQEVLREKDKEIEKLNQSNAYLAKIVHRDNHLMSNVNTSIDMYFNSNDETYKETLLRDLQTLAKERNEVINKEQLKSKLLPSTGNLLIDGAINDLYIKAAAHGIDFNLTVTSTVDEIIGKYISQTDLQTLLCDHIKDAIIAVDSYGESGGKILVNLSKQNDNYCIDIYDSGVAFEPDTLSKLGTERVTTHEDSGGSGIGFMTTFETIKKAYASLIITEFEHRSPFSKSVSFRFDGESAFIINSYRKDELQQLIKRNDVIYL